MTIGAWDRFEAEFRRPDGTRRQLDAQCHRTPEGFILSVRDISDTVEMLRRVEIAASHDMLTRLPNRLSFETALREQLQVDGSASVVFMDLDGFKRSTTPADMLPVTPCSYKSPTGLRASSTTASWLDSAATSSRSCFAAESAKMARSCSPPMPSRPLPAPITLQATRSRSARLPDFRTPIAVRSRRSCATPTWPCMKPSPTAMARCGSSTRPCTTAKSAASNWTRDCDEHSAPKTSASTTSRCSTSRRGRSPQPRRWSAGSTASRPCWRPTNSSGWPNPRAASRRWANG